MDSTIAAAELLGFATILTGLSFLLVRLAQIVIQGKRAQIRYGLEALAVLIILYFAAEPGFQFVSLEQFGVNFARAVAFLLWIDLAFVIDKSLRLYAWDGLLSENGKRNVPKLVTGGVTTLLYTSAIALVLHYHFDRPITTLLASSGALALVLGFSAQSTLKEVFSGISLNLSNAIRMGDFVEIDGIYGQIFDINWRSISVKNPHTDSLYVFPNSIVAEKTILNFSEPTGRFKYFVNFVTEVSAPPEKVIRAIAQEIAYSRYVFRDPKPDFNILGYTECGLEIRVRFFFDGDDPWWDAQNEMCMAIWAAMRKHGFRLGIKRYYMGSDIEWLTLDEDVARRFPTDRIVSIVQENSAFEKLNESQLTTLAESASILDLNPPSCFYHPGDDSDCFYIMLEGDVGIYREHEGQELCIDHCERGDLFGLTGFTAKQERIHLAQAEEYSIALCINSKDLEPVRDAVPALQEQLSYRVADRRPHREKHFEKELKLLKQNHRTSQKNHLRQELRKSIDHLLTQSLANSIRGHFFSRTAHEVLLNAVVAACALVIRARGKVDDDEVRYIKDTLHESNLFKHVDEVHALEQFEYFIGELDGGRRQTVLDAVAKLARDSHKAHLVLAICHGLEHVHDTATEAEDAAVQEVADTLGIHNDAQGMTDKMREKRGIKQF